MNLLMGKGRPAIVLRDCEETRKLLKSHPSKESIEKGKRKAKLFDTLVLGKEKDED